MLLLGSNMLAAREENPQKALESAEQPSTVLDVQKSPDDASEGDEGSLK
jgi:hypothetical protein